MIEFENLKNSNKPYIKDLEKAAIKVINSIIIKDKYLFFTTL